jgi:plasmid maintenance system antidote protein VapI
MTDPIQPPRFEFTPDYVSPPGETLREVIDDRGISVVDLAEQSGLSCDAVAGVLEGKTAITVQIAKGLARALGVPASFWLRREEMYREGGKQNV